MTTRSRFIGVSKIVRFNAPMYAASTAVITGALGAVWLWPLPPSLSWTLATAAGVAGFYLVASLAASHVIYDLSDLYRWGWLRRLPLSDQGIFVNLHAGFDETSEALRGAFPKAAWRLLDCHDPAGASEPSIVRARALYPAPAGTEVVRPGALPLADHTTHAVFSVLAAHEIRDHAGRVALAREVRRALRADGAWIVVEHLRDAANFAAFGPGFLHFFSRAAWRRVFAEGGLRVADEFRVTPFIAVFVLHRDD